MSSIEPERMTKSCEAGSPSSTRASSPGWYERSRTAAATRASSSWLRWSKGGNRPRKAATSSTRLRLLSILLLHEQDRDLRPPPHAIWLLGPHPVRQQPGTGGIRGHHDHVAAEALGLRDDSLGGFARRQNMAVG